MAGRILYITDKYKVANGYEPAFKKLLTKAKLDRSRVILSDIYNVVDKPLIKKANEGTWKFNPEKKDEILKAFTQRVRSVKPSVIVVSCPAVLGVLSGWDFKLSTLDKMRGGVYYFDSIPCIIVYPITAIHKKLDTRIIENLETGEQDTQQPYRVPQGSQILAWDWQKVGRFYHGKQRNHPKFTYSVCRTLADCFAAREYLTGCRLISEDIETGANPALITCVGFTGIRPDGRMHSFVIPLYDAFAEGGTFWDSLEDHAIAWSVIRDINSLAILKTMQNGNYDCSYFIRDLIPTVNYLLDSMVMWWSFYMELPKSLDFISSVLLDNFQYWKDDIKGSKEDEVSTRANSMERYWRYNALDSYNTLLNTLYLLQMMQNNERARNNFAEAMLRLFSGLAMGMRGLPANKARREEHRVELTRDRDEGAKQLRYILCDPDFNVNSAQQKASLLYDFFGLRPRNAKGRYCKAGEPPSAGAIPLKLAKTEHPLFKYIIEKMESAMEPDKQISNVCNMKIYTDRFRTAYNPVGTETTRFSSKGSNFWDCGNSQNIRKKYRDWIQADKHHILLDVDYSQSDDVFVAYESEDPDKIAVVESGKDAHAVNGELFFGKSYEWIVAGKKAHDPAVVHPITGIRQIAKRVVHGTNFQMAGMTLYVTMGRDAVVAAALILGFKNPESWSQEQLIQLCQKLMLKYRKKYKRLTAKEWYKDVAKELATGFVTNAFGTARKFLGDPNESGTQREATAYIGQSDTAGNMNRVMAEIDFGYMRREFRDGLNPDYGVTPLMMTKESHGFSYHLQVHDNFVAQLDTRHPKWITAAHNLLTVMDRPVIIKGREVRIKAEAEIGLAWGGDMTFWNGDVNTLESLAKQLQS